MGTPTGDELPRLVQVCRRPGQRRGVGERKAELDELLSAPKADPQPLVANAPGEPWSRSFRLLGLHA
jgi:hypothetical protein